MTARQALVIGGGGFIGRHTCTALRSAGWQPVSAGRRAVVEEGLGALLAKHTPDLVVNAAGTVWSSNEDALHASNVLLADAVVGAILYYRSPTRLVHLGSSLEYAPTTVGATCHEATTPAQPQTVYGCTKLQATRRITEAVQHGGLDATVLRVFNCVGPGGNPAGLQGSLVARLRTARRCQEPAAVPLPRPVQHRDFIDVRDVAAAVVAAAGVGTGRGAQETIVNIGRGAATSTEFVVRRFFELNGADVSFVEPASAPEPHAGSLHWQCADIERAKRCLGWRPRYSLDRSFRDIGLSAEPLVS